MKELKGQNSFILRLSSGSVYVLTGIRTDRQSLSSAGQIASLSFGSEPVSNT